MFVEPNKRFSTFSRDAGEEEKKKKRSPLQRHFCVASWNRNHLYWSLQRKWSDRWQPRCTWTSHSWFQWRRLTENVPAGWVEEGFKVHFRLLFTDLAALERNAQHLPGERQVLKHACRVTALNELCGAFYFPCMRHILQPADVWSCSVVRLDPQCLDKQLLSKWLFMHRV